MLKTTSVADLLLGIDNVSDETSLPAKAARDMRNVDLNGVGNFRTRRGFTLLAPALDAHSLWGSRDQSFGLYVQGAGLRRLIVQDGQTLSAQVLTVMPGLPMSYFEYADEAFFSNGTDLGVVTRTGARMLGVDAPRAPLLSTAAGGSTAAGKYSVALSFVSATGEESGLSAIESCTLDADSSVTVSLPTGAGTGAVRVRVYCTPTNGDVLYQAAELPIGLTSYVLNLTVLGKAADNQFLSRMRPGRIVRAFNGRLVTAQGDTVWFSEPYRYGLTSLRHNFVRFNSAVTVVEPVTGGVFVGTREAVYFLAGDGPRTFQQGVASTNGPGVGGSTLVPSSALPKKYADQTSGMAAVWLGPRGYSVGLPSGMAHDIQQDRLDLPQIEAGRTVFWTVDGLKQVVSVVESPLSAGPGAAIDSTI